MPPIYEYQCPKCGKTHEEIMSFADYDASEGTTCSHCNAPLLKDDRIIGGGLKTTVIGVSKGNYGSGDWS